MPRFRSHCSARNLAIVSGIGALCLPLWLSLIPHLDMGRTEARIQQAFDQVRRLQNEYNNSSNATRNEMPPDEPALKDNDDATPLSELDPWGQPYQLVTTRAGNSHIVRVFSFGPDTSSASNGRDPNDISSDMTVRPTKTFEDRRRRQWLVAFGVSGMAWFTASWLYFSGASRRSGHSSSPTRPHFFTS